MEKTNDLGVIKISDSAFEKLIKEGLALTDGRDSLALERKSIIIRESEKMLYLEFHVVHKFGTSMIFSSSTVLDYLEKTLRAAKLGKPVSITMKIVAIKARRSIKTNHELMRLVI